MRTSTKWLAVVRDEHWVVAKVKCSKVKIEVAQLAEYDLLLSGKEEEEPPEDIAEESSLGIKESKGTAEIGQNLRQWLKREKIPLNHINIAFSCPGVITRVITLPELNQKDMDTLLTEEVEQYFTLNLDDYLVDYRVLDHYREGHQFRVRVLLAALPKEPWEKFWQICQEAGLGLKVVDLAADSILRLYVWSEALAIDKKYYVNKSKIKADYQRMLLKDRMLKKLPGQLVRKLRRTRTTAPSTSFWSRIRLPKLKKAANFEESSPGLRDSAIVALHQGRVEIIILEQGEFFLYSDLDFAWEPDADVDRELLENALSPVIRVLMEFVNFFAARHFGKPVDDIFLTGELAIYEEFADIFTERLGIQVNIGFPNGWRPTFQKKAQDRNQQWMKYAALYGLALRED